MAISISIHNVSCIQISPVRKLWRDKGGEPVFWETATINFRNAEGHLLESIAVHGEDGAALGLPDDASEQEAA